MHIMSNLSKKNIRRALVILNDGGLPALWSAVRRRINHRKGGGSDAILITPLSVGLKEIVADFKVPGLGNAKDGRALAAKLRPEEIVIFATESFQYLAGFHRPAQLANAALSAGHHVIYVTDDHSVSFDRVQPGLLQLKMQDLNAGDLFKCVSERAVILNFTISHSVLSLLKYAQNRGLCIHSHCDGGRPVDSELFRLVAGLSTSVICSSDEIAQSLEMGGSIKVIAPAASHSYFDVYRQYAEPEEFHGKNQGKALVFAPGAESLIDWDYLVCTAELNPEITFFLLGLTSLTCSLPSNIVILSEDRLEQANAFASHVDFILVPLMHGALTIEAVLQGSLVGGFLNKPILCSQPIVFEQLEGLQYRPTPERLGDLVNFLRVPRPNDLFVASNSWLARLEALVPITPRNDVSVVILIHNNARIIARCLETLQRHCDAFIREVIVVDNASSDGGAEIVEREFPQVKLVRNPENGCSSGRNLGVKYATGKYIAFFDSDQWFTGGSGFAEALSILDRHASVGVIGWNAGWFDATREDLGGMISDYCPNRAMNAETIFRGYRSDIGFLGTSGFFMRRVTFDAIEGFDTYYDPTCFEDTDLCFQIRALGMEVAFRDLSGVRHQPHQTTGADSGSEKYKALFHRNSNYFKDKWKKYPDFYIDYKWD